VAELRAATKCYVGLCPTCGRMEACSVATPERAGDNSRFVAALVLAGVTVQTLPVSEVRAAEWCQCDAPKAEEPR
jgi:hypothetical protein